MGIRYLGFQKVGAFWGVPVIRATFCASFFGPPIHGNTHFIKQGMILAPWPRLRTKTVEEDAALAAKAGVDNSLKVFFGVQGRGLVFRDLGLMFSGYCLAI